MKPNKEHPDKWGTAQVPEGTRKELIRQILRGTVDRDAFPDLWPRKRIIVVLPKEESND